MFKPETVLAEEIVIAQINLYKLYENYAEGKGFDLDRYIALERNLDNIFAKTMNIRNTKTYPNPCSEILLPAVRGNYYESV